MRAFCLCFVSHTAYFGWQITLARGHLAHEFVSDHRDGGLVCSLPLTLFPPPHLQDDC